MRSRWLAWMLVGLLLPGCKDDPERGGSGARPTGPAATAGPQHAAQPAPQGIASHGPAGAPRLPAADEGDDGDDGPNDEAPDCAPPDSSLKPLQLLRFTFTGAVENREPTTKLHIARPGQRVWAHLRVRNRSGRARCLHVVFRVNGAKRTELDLEIGESWNWRTWAYNTVKSSDRSGALELEITDDQGKHLVKERLPIVPKSN